MKRLAPVIALLALLCLPVHAHAQDAIAGTWRVTKIRGNELPKAVQVSLTFAADNQATLAYTLDDEAPQTWRFTYSLDDGVFTLKPAKPVGKPDSLEFEIRLKDNTLQFLPPKPEPEPEAEAKPEGEDAADAEASPTPDNAEAAEEPAEQEDTREPVWELVAVAATP